MGSFVHFRRCPRPRPCRPPRPPPQRRPAGRFPDGTPLRRPHALRRQLPPAGHGQRPLPDAWRSQHRSAHARGPRPLRPRPAHPRRLLGSDARPQCRSPRLDQAHPRPRRPPAPPPYRWAWVLPHVSIVGASGARPTAGAIARKHPAVARMGERRSPLRHPVASAGHGVLPPVSPSRPSRRAIRLLSGAAPLAPFSAGHLPAVRLRQAGGVPASLCAPGQFPADDGASPAGGLSARRRMV